MRAVKITGIVIIGLWMAWVSWEIVRIDRDAYQGCVYARIAQARLGGEPERRYWDCPLVIY